MSQTADFVTEEHCSVCSSVPSIERPLFRLGLAKLPLRETICEACAMAFFRNLGISVRADNDHRRMEAST